jgi:hypothetical protein
LAIELLDNPLITSLEEDMMGSFGSFPDEIYLISVGGDKFACNNATTPDGMTVNGLACFLSPDDATTYMGVEKHLDGEIKKSSFNDARDIAKSKPKLDCLFLFHGVQIIEIHFVR